MAWWWCYPTPSEGLGRGGTPRRPNSRATPQGLDQRSKNKSLVKTLLTHPSTGPGLPTPFPRAGNLPPLSPYTNPVNLPTLQPLIVQFLSLPVLLMALFALSARLPSAGLRGCFDYRLRAGMAASGSLISGNEDLFREISSKTIN